MAALDWVGKAQRRVNKDPAYRALGTADIDLALKAGKTIRRVIFSAFEVVRIEDGDATTLVDVDVVIEMTAREWNGYLKKRNKGDGPSLTSLDIDKSVVRARNPLDRLKLDRCMRSVQAFIDQGARYVA